MQISTIFSIKSQISTLDKTCYAACILPVHMTKLKPMTIITIDTSHTISHAALCPHCMCRDASLRWLPLCCPSFLKCFDRNLGTNKFTTLDASTFSGLSLLRELFVRPNCHMLDTHAVCVSMVYVQTHVISSRLCVTIVARCNGSMCMRGDSM